MDVLHHMMQNLKDVVEMLLNGGAEPRKETKSGKTPLFLSHQHGRMDIVNILNDALNQQ